jgi:hypothetical protein
MKKYRIDIDSIMGHVCVGVFLTEKEHSMFEELAVAFEENTKRVTDPTFTIHEVLQ